MPNEYDEIVASKDKNMSDGRYEEMRDQYDKKIAELGNRTRKLILAFLGVYAVSFALLYMRLLFGNNDEIITSCYVLLAEFFIAIFFYDPKDDKKYAYEKDKGILLNSQKRKLAAIKIRLGLVIGLGALFSLLNIIFWSVFGFVPAGESLGSSLLFFDVFSV